MMMSSSGAGLVWGSTSTTTIVVALAGALVVVLLTNISNGAILGAAFGRTPEWWWRRRKEEEEDPSHRQKKENTDDKDDDDDDAWERLAQSQRRRLPDTIVLVRHGESEANADRSVWQTIPDNLLGLTLEGQAQATQVGHRIAQILTTRHCARVHLVVSPFERTLQTAVRLRVAFESSIVRTDIESRIREQEMGNLQGSEFAVYRQEQQKVGRFWYRFPTGESGADVLDRVKSWWYESVLGVNLRVGFAEIDGMVVVTHGLTLRFILMQLFGWSPTTFHSVWNAQNCDVYVLTKDLSKPGNSPYVLDATLGDVPRSSIDVLVQLKGCEEPRLLKLENYLSVPPPRTTRVRLIKRMLAQQYNLDTKDMGNLVFMPFVHGGVIKGRSTSGVLSRASTMSLSRHCSDHAVPENASHNSNADESDDNDDNDDDESDNDDGNDQYNDNLEMARRPSFGISQSSTSNDDGSAQFDRRNSARTNSVEVSGRFPCVNLTDFS